MQRLQKLNKVHTQSIHKPNKKNQKKKEEFLDPISEEFSSAELDNTYANYLRYEKKLENEDILIQNEKPEKKLKENNDLTGWGKSSPSLFKIKRKRLGVSTATPKKRKIIKKKAISPNNKVKSNSLDLSGDIYPDKRMAQKCQTIRDFAGSLTGSLRKSGNSNFSLSFHNNSETLGVTDLIFLKII